MINKRVKEGFRKIKKPSKQLKFSLGTIAVVLSCLMLLIIATFTQITLNFSLPDSSLLTTLKFEYIPQIPVVIFIAALLGNRWGVFTILLYIILGLTPWYPVFGLGGGLSYIFQYSFGYIVAYIFAVYLCAKELRKETSVLHIILAVFYGVFIVHIIGIIYMTTIAILRHDTWSFIYDLIFYQSLAKIIYDLVFSLIAIIVAKCCKKMLWIVTG